MSAPDPAAGDVALKAPSPAPYQLGYRVPAERDDGSSVPADFLPASPAEAGRHFLAKDWDVAQTAFAAARYTGSVGGNDLAMSDAIDDRNQQLFQATGVRLENPLAGGYAQEAFAAAAQQPAPDPTDTSAGDTTPQRLDAYQAALTKLQADHPQAFAANPALAQPLDQARNARIRTAERAASAAAYKDGGFAILPNLAGGLAASVRDPVQLGLMAVPVGGEIKAASTLGLLTRHALHAGAVNAGFQAVQEPMLQANAAARGDPHGFGEAAKEIGAAGVFGGLFGVGAGAFHAFAKAGPARRAAVLAGDPAAVAAIAPADAPVLHAAATDHALDRAVMEHRPSRDGIGVDFPERADPARLAQAVRDSARFGEGIGPLPEIVADKAPEGAAVPPAALRAPSLREAIEAVRAEPDGLAAALASDVPAVARLGRLAQLSDRALDLVERGDVTPEVAAHIPALFPEPTDHAFLVDLLRQDGVIDEARARQVLSDERQARGYPEAAAAILGERRAPSDEAQAEPSADPAQPEPPPPPVRQPRETPAGPQSLLGFLRSKGGLKDAGGELAARDLHRQFPGLVNNARGVPLDRAREAAAELGYLGADTAHAVASTTIDDLLDAIERHPVYRVQDEGGIADRAAAAKRRAHARDVKAAIADVEAHLAGAGENTDRELITAAAERMVAHGEDVETALHGASDDALASEQPHDVDADHFPPGFFDGVSFSGEDAYRDGGARDGGAAALDRAPREAGDDAGAVGGSPGDGDLRHLDTAGALERDALDPLASRGTDMLDRVPFAEREDGGDASYLHPFDLAARDAPEDVQARLVDDCPF